MLFLTCIGVILHFVSSTHKLQKVVLDLIYFPPPHTGTEVAKLTTSVFKEWDIQVENQPEKLESRRLAVPELIHKEGDD